MNEKQKLFALYWGQRVLNPYSLLTYTNTGVLKVIDSVQLSNVRENDKLRLTHPSKITNEHCVELFDLVYPLAVSDREDVEKIHWAKYWIANDITTSITQSETIISFLRSKGYAFQCNGRSIEEQVESGDVELK